MPRSYGLRGVRLVRHYVRKRSYSTLDRVMTHLSREALRPEEQTQEGIAVATRSGRSTLTKWLDRLERRGLVTRDRIRLPGHPLPKYAYRLSETGWQTAAALRQWLTSQVVTVRAPNLGALSVRVSEIPGLASARLDLTGAIASVHKGQLDLTRAAHGYRNQGSVVWGSGLRRVDRFFGRTDELRDLDTWWASDSPILILTGLAGIGKSTLVAAWVQGRRLGVPVCGFEVRRSSTSAGFLSDLGAFLKALGKPGLAAYLAQGLPLDLAFVSRLLDRDLGGETVLLIVDNANEASRHVARLVERLFIKGSSKFSAKLVLLGRRPPRWIDLVNQSASSPEVRQLRGLDPIASKALLRSRGLGPDSGLTEEVIRKTRGHPLLLHLAASTGTGHGSRVQRYLEKEVWGSLTAKDRSVLKAMSIFRKTVSERVLENVARTDHRTLQRLADRNLLERTITGGYVMHDLVREFVAGQLSETSRERFHARAAGLLLHGIDARERWEGVYHLLEAGKVAEAAALLDSEGSPLLDCVAAEEIASLVHRITLQETESATYCVFAEILGDSLRIRGHVGPALLQYGHAQRLAESSGQSARVPRLLRKMAFLERCRNRYPKALGYLVEARARLLEMKDPVEMVEVLREMALAEQASGDLEESVRHLNDSIDLATDASDRSALSRTLLALGSLEAQRGHLDQGLELDLEGLRVAQRSGNVTEIAHAHIVLGAALIGMGRADESLKHFTDGLGAARLLGNLRLMAYATMNQTSALLHLGRYREAGTWLRQAMGYFEILEEKDTVGFLKTYEGEMEMGLGRWSRAADAWREGVRTLRSHGSPAELALVLRDVAGFYARHGDAGESQSYLLEAREIARKVGNLDLLSRIESDLTLLRATPVRNSSL